MELPESAKLPNIAENENRDFPSELICSLRDKSVF